MGGQWRAHTAGCGRRRRQTAANESVSLRPVTGPAPRGRMKSDPTGPTKGLLASTVSQPSPGTEPLAAGARFSVSSGRTRAARDWPTARPRRNPDRDLRPLPPSEATDSATDSGHPCAFVWRRWAVVVPFEPQSPDRSFCTCGCLICAARSTLARPRLGGRGSLGPFISSAPSAVCRSALHHPWTGPLSLPAAIPDYSLLRPCLHCVYSFTHSLSSTTRRPLTFTVAVASLRFNHCDAFTITLNNTFVRFRVVLSTSIRYIHCLGPISLSP